MWCFNLTMASSRKRVVFLWFCVLGVGASLLACGEDSPAPPLVEKAPGDDVGYEPNTSVVVIDGETYIVTGALGEDCVQIGNDCLDLSTIKLEKCGDINAQVDVIYFDGTVVDIICYPPQGSGVSITEVTENSEGQIEVPQNRNNTVITFADETNGQPIEGNVTLEAERIVLLGNGVEETIINGNLVIAANNAKIRGLTIMGNVEFEENANNASLAFCRIKGNLKIKSNDVSVLNCQVFGNVEVEGNGGLLVGVGLEGKWHITGKNITCQSNYTFQDGNNDFTVQPEEVLQQGLSCAAAK